MSIKTATTSITSASSARSGQSKTYQYPSGNGVVITGSSINNQTTAYLDVTTPGAARSFTAVSGGGGATALISNIRYLDANNVVANAIAVSTTGGNILINGNGFTNGSRVYVNNQLVTNTFVNSNAIIATLSANSVGNVSLAIFNSSGQNGVFSNSNVRFSGAPSWVTAAAVSSVNGVASNIALQASGDGTLTYSLKSGSGSLPTGITLLSSGYLTGTATGYNADTVVSFTLIVSDPESQETQQNFNYTVFIGDTYFKQTSLLLSATVSNTFISDSSTNNFLITRFGDTKPSRFSPYWPGGWSGYFDGSGDYLSASANSAFDITGDFTIEAWVYFTALPGTNIDNNRIAGIAGYTNGSTGNAGWEFGVNFTANTFSTGSWGSGNQIQCSFTPSLGIWYHFAATKSGSTSRLFINGINQTLTVNTLTINNGSSPTLNIGRSSSNTQYFHYVPGYISNFRIVKGTALYTANFTPSTSSLTTVANTSLLTLRDSILSDDSAYNHSITRNGDVRLTTFSPFSTNPHTITPNGYSVYLDGNGDYLQAPSSSTALINLTGDFTVEAWINPSNTYGPLFYLSGNTDSYAAVRLYYNAPGVGLLSTTSYGSWNINSGTVGTGLSAGVWGHVALVRDGGTIRIFVNGTQVYTSTAIGSNSSLYSATLNLLGALANNIGSGINEYYTGLISNFRVVKNTALYTANFTPSTTALTAVSNTSILTCQANTIIDSNTTPKTITVNGNPNVSIANPFGETVTTINNYSWSANSYGASAYFDGTGDYLNAGSNAAFAFGTGAYTIECWVYPTALNAQVFVGIRATGGLQLFYDTTSGVGLSSVGSAGFLFAGTLSLNQWYHIAAVRSSTASNDTRIYINGALRAIGTDSTNWTVNGPLIIAANQNGTETFTGYMTDVRWTKGTAIYPTSFVPPAAPVSNVANVSLLTLQSDIGSNSAQFVDQSPNNHLITRNGNASQGTYGPLVPSTWSAYFDGSGDYLTVPNNTAFNFGTGDFTIECWIYTISSATQRIISYANASNTPYELLLVNTGSNVYLDFYDGTSDLTTGSNYVAQNSWAHVAVTRSGTALRLFINGVISGSFTNSVNLTSAGSLFIGRYQPSDLQPFVGYISNLRIVKGTALYTANFTPSTTTISPVANTSLLTLRGPAFTDDSGNNFTLTRNGDTKIVPFGPFSPQIVTPDSYSYRFSNASDYISTTSSNLAFGSNNWTIEGWVYPRFTANSGVFQVSNVQYGLTNSNLNTVALGFSNSNKAIVRVANATYTSTGTSITANAWTHLALVKSSNVSKLYINGTLDSTIGTSGSITDTVSYTGTTNVAVGGYGSTSALANAYISNFRIVSNSAVYTENFTPAVGPLSAISGTTLLTCQANTILDASGSNLTITANANVSPSNFNPFDETVTVGQQYSALADGGSTYFDGSGDYLSLPTNPALDLGTGNFTIDCWFYLTGNSAQNGATNRFAQILGRYATANNTGYELNIAGNSTTTGTGFEFINTVAGTQYKISANITISQQQWNHLAIVRNSTTTSIYFNGSLIGSGTLGNQSITSTNDLWIGALNVTSYNHFINGYISNLRIIKGTALYTSNFVPPAAPALPTVANTSLLLNFTSSGVIDSTGRNIIESVNDAKVTTNLKKYGTGSYYFDGTTDRFIVTSDQLNSLASGDFTVELWAYPLAVNVGQALIYRGASNYATASDLQYYIYITSAGQVVVRPYQSTTDYTTSIGAISANAWTHIAFVRNGNTFMGFVNGTKSGNTQTISGSLNDNAAWPGAIMGYGILNGTNELQFNGYIADVRVTKGYARYTANFTVPSEPFLLK